jgi:hypothetical protein
MVGPSSGEQSGESGVESNGHPDGIGPDLDELRAWLVTVGDARPPVEPDLDAIVGRAGQRVFRRRIGTGLALLGLIVPGAALLPLAMAGDDTAVVADGGVVELDCLGRLEAVGAAYGPCRFE